MFERFTEPARRVVFFARYEASACHVSQIGSEHLLLGLCRETAIKDSLPVDEIRRQATKLANPPVSTSVDLPLSAESKRILARGATEAELLGSRGIDCLHLALGILREPESGAARFLHEHGLTPEKLKGLLRIEPLQSPTLDGPVLASVLLLQERLVSSIPALENIRDTEKGLPEGWTRKQALGHLVDLALANYRWLNLPKPVSMQLEPAKTWTELLQLWKSTNEKLLEAAGQIPPEGWTRLRLSLMESYADRTAAILREMLP